MRHVNHVRAASPGRIEFIGNHVDYNGGQVLGVALNLAVRANGERLPGKELQFASDGSGNEFKGHLDAIVPQTGFLSWTNYPLGILAVLRDAGYPLVHGMRLTFSSDLPSGAGLSSSAAIELATLEAVCALQGFTLTRKEKVLLAQRAENEFVGVPCGILDQAVSCFGKTDHLVRIDCLNTEFSTVPLPEGLRFWIFNTNLKHSLVDSLYAERHRECRQALSEIQEAFPEVHQLAEAPAKGLEVLRELPKLQKRARHVISENQRVKACIEALEAQDLNEVGELLYQSHESSSRFFENSTPELDALVALLREDRSSGVVGARLTGGGFGGAVMALARDTFSPSDAQAVIDTYVSRCPNAPIPSVISVTTGPGTRVLA